MTEQGACLSKVPVPGQLQKQFEVTYGNDSLPGQFFSVDEQCKMIRGPLSFYCKGVRLETKTDPKIRLIYIRFMFIYRKQNQIFFKAMINLFVRI